MEKDEISIHVTGRDGSEKTITGPLGMDLTLMELCKASGFSIKATCGGMALCSTCHCYIESDHVIPEMSEAEEDMLDQAFFVEDNSRLSCQIRLSEKLDGLRIRLAPEDEDI
jgi:2Fe-2S ferredoxin